MATAPFQLLMDLPPIASAIRSGSTVTVTTALAHNLTTGAYVEIGNTTGPAGSTMTGVYQITTTSGTAFTYTAAGNAGTATVGSAFASVDLLNPAENLAAGTARQQAMIADPSSLQLSANGDGSSSTMSLVITQETTPSAGPWFSTVPDNTRFRLVQKDTGSASVVADRRFVGVLTSLAVDLNGSGQGTITTLNLSDANWLLERIGVYGQMVSARSITTTGISRSSNVSTITFGVSHGFVQGQTIRVTGAMGGGSGGSGASFNGVFKIKSVPDARTLTYDNPGPNAVSLTSAAINGSVVSGAKDRIQISGRFVDLNIESGTQLGITGFGASGGTSPSAFLRLIRTGYNGSRVINNGANSVILVLPSAYSGSMPTLTSTGDVYVGRPVVAAEGFNGQLVVTIPGGLTEDTAMARLMTVANAYSADDYALQRLVSTSDVSKIVGGTTYINSDAIQFSADSLRSSIETIIETYSGNDAKDRRYYVNLAGQIVYELVDPASKPTYATAPYVITTDAVAGTPNTTTGKASVTPYDLTVNYDHEITKRAMFTIPSSTGTAVSAIVDFDQALRMDGTAAYSARSGPMLSAIVDYPTVVKDAASRIASASAAWFLERHKPLLSGQFTLRGAGTATFNKYGFTAGYAQTGTASYSLVERWEPGQWVEVNSASLGLSGLYRVEQVEWSLEPGSYLQTVTVYFNRKNPSDLASLIANNRA